MAIIQKVNFREVEIKVLFMVNYDIQNFSVDILGRNKVRERDNEENQGILKVLYCCKKKIDFMRLEHPALRYRAEPSLSSFAVLIMLLNEKWRHKTFLSTIC